MKDPMTIFREMSKLDDKEQMIEYLQNLERVPEDEEKPKTNADRIRAMSDEELAAWMAECNAYGENADASQWLPWLQQPAEETN